MKYLKTYNESLRDKMKPKSDEEILRELDDLSPEELLFISIENNYIKGVEKVLKLGADINYKYKYGWTPLLFATMKGHKDIVEFLIENGADINVKYGADGNTPLLFATRCEYKDIVEILLKNGADTNIKDDRGYTALMYASEYFYKDKEIIKLLKKYGATE
jgi:ankyrin repeat protein